MDNVEGILDWISQNSRNLSETQKNEIHGLLESLTNQLHSGIGSSSQARDHQTHHFSQTMPSERNQNEEKYHRKPYNNNRNWSLESKINRVTNSMSKETGYIHGKIDTLSKEYEKQIKSLKNQIKGLQKDKTQKQREKNKVSDSQINHLTESLKSLMKRETHAVPGPYHYPPQPPPPYDYFPSNPPNQHFPHFRNLHAAPKPPVPRSGSSVASPFSFPGSYVGSNIPKPPPYKKIETVYRCSGNNSGCGLNGKGDRNAASSSSHKLFSHGNDAKADGNSRKKYCDPVWKKSADRHTEPMKESPKKVDGKFHNKFPSRGASQVPPFKDYRKEPTTHKTGHFRHFKGATNQNPPLNINIFINTQKNTQPPSKDKPSKLQNNPKNSCDASTPSQGFSKNFGKKKYY